MDFFKSYWYLFAIAAAVLLAAALLWVLLRRRKRRKREAELVQLQNRNDALNEALRNPLIQRMPGSDGTPVSITWDSESVRDRGKSGTREVIELEELAVYSKKKYVFPSHTPIRIGSGKENNLILQRDGVAAHHCEVLMLGGSPIVRSVGNASTILKRGKDRASVSENGVYLNQDDHILVGTSELCFHIYQS